MDDETTTARPRRQAAMKTSPAKSRTRPPHQAAQVILRMSEAERDVVHAAAAEGGYSSTVKYLLALVARDASRRANIDQDVVVGMFAKAEGPDPESGRDLHAMADTQFAAAVG